MTAVEIFTKPGCGWAQRNYALLIEKRVAFRTVLSCDASGRKTEVFAGLSPYAATPILRIGEDVVWESSLINEFLDERFPQTPMMPKGAGPRAAARLWAYHCDAVIMPAIKRLARAGAGAGGEARAELDHRLAQLSAGLAAQGGGPFWAGSRLTLPDLIAQTVFESLEAVEAAGRLDPRLDDWRRALAASPSVIAAGGVAAAVSYQVPVREIVPP
jgi:glutathione S-transferase